LLVRCQNNISCLGSPSQLIQQVSRVWSVEECRQRCLAAKACNYFTSYALVERTGLMAGQCLLYLKCLAFNYQCQKCHLGET
jgi:hypothetical protein